MPTTKSKPVRLRKVVVVPGKWVKRSTSGEPIREIELSETRLRRIAETGNKMIEDGLAHPVPAKHIFDGKVVSPLAKKEGKGKTPTKLVDARSGNPPSWNANDNLGFVKEWSYGSLTDDEGKTETGLIADIESYGDPDDPSTPAGKLGTTIRATSLGFVSEYTDTLNRKYLDAPIHVATVLDPVSPNRTNFVHTAPVGPTVTLLSLSPGERGDDEAVEYTLLSNHEEPPFAKKKMDEQGDEGDSPSPITGTMKESSSSMGEEQDSSDDAFDNADSTISGGSSLDRLIEVANKSGILNLPEDTTPENVIDRLVTLLHNMAPKVEDNPFGDVPQDSSADPNARVQVTTMSLDEDPLPPKNMSTINALLSLAASSHRDTLRNRATALHRKGVLSKDYLDKTLSPLIEASEAPILMSGDEPELDENGSLKTKKTNVELILEALETAGGGLLSQAPDGTTTVEPPTDLTRDGVEADRIKEIEEDADADCAELLNMAR